MENVTVLGLVTYLLYSLPTSLSSHHHVIRASGSASGSASAFINLGPVLETLTATSRSECASMCASSSNCRASMLMGNTCRLYARSCSCSNGERLSRDLPSKYLLIVPPLVASVTAWVDAGAECEGLGMHLLAINSEVEQLAIADLLATRAPECTFTYTSGFSPTPGSPNVSDWRWEMTSYHSQPLTYTHWAVGQPDNFNGVGQDVIALMSSKGYQWGDVKREANGVKLYCHICECTEGL